MILEKRIRRGGEKPSAKLREQDVRELRAFVADNPVDAHAEKIREVSARSGTCYDTVRKAAYRITWKHI